MKTFLFLLTFLTVFYACKKQETPPPAPTINIPKTNYSIVAEGGTVEVYLQTDAILQVKLDPQVDWISKIGTKSTRLDMFTFSCLPNNTFERRSVKITFTEPQSNVSETIEITQSANVDAEPSITSFVFEVAKNRNQLISDIVGVINNDNIISVRIPYRLESKELIPTISFDGTEMIVENENLDFTQPVKYTVKNQTGTTKEYVVQVSTHNSIPVLYITTENNAPIVSKDDYLKAVAKFDGNGIEQSFEASLQIKGRGNSTWTNPKKPYRLKFDKKISIAGFPVHKDWILLANYVDRTLIKNSVAFKIGSLLDMDWSNRGCFVDVYINNVYNGNYLLCEQIKIDKDRVNIAKLDDTDITEPNITGGYLLELDTYYDEPQKFRSAIRNLPVMIKDPELNNIQFEWIKNHFNEAENVMYSADFADPENGYVKYIDVASFIDWWLLHEIMGNGEPGWPKSSYMSKDRGGKLKMGPIWDFDYGTCTTPDVFYNNSAIWFDKLFQDPNFVQKVKNRWNEKKLILSEIISHINSQADLLQYSQVQDVLRWGGSADGIMRYEYNTYISNMKNYFTKRFEWLDTEINKM